MAAPKSNKKTTENNKSEEYAVKFLNNEGLDVDQISEKLNLEKSVVEKIVSSHKKSSNLKSAQDMMIRHTAEKKINNVSIMTRDAAMAADELIKKTATTNSRKESIFRPRG